MQAQYLGRHETARERRIRLEYEADEARMRYCEQHDRMFDAEAPCQGCAAAALGRKGGKAGTGEAKRRGDSAYYKALRKGLCTSCGRSRWFPALECKNVCHTIPRCANIKCHQPVYAERLCFAHFQAR